MIKHILTLVWNKKRTNMLMMLEIFLAFLILFSVFTFAINFLRMYQSPLGFATRDALLVQLMLDDGMDSVAHLEMRQQLRREVELLPAVQTTSFNSGVTMFSGSMWTTSNNDNGFLLETCIYHADEQFAAAASLNLVEGRWPEVSDQNNKYAPVVINRRLREAYFGDKPVIDSIIMLDGEKKIMGVVDHFKYQGEFETERPLTFFFLPLHDENLRTLYVRLKPNTPPEFEEELNKTIARVTRRRDFVISSVDADRVRQSRQVWVPMITALLICGFLILNVALGLFGVLYYNISKRRAEIGLRRALGATQGAITRQFTAEVMVVAAAGMLLAILIAVQFPLLAVFDVPAENFYWSILATTILILLVVLFCAFSPSRQAAAVQPAVALHEE